MTSGADLASLAADLIGGDAGTWDQAARIPDETLRKLASSGLLSAEIGTQYGGHGLSSAENGELTAAVGGICSSVRSLMTSQGMAAWTLSRQGTHRQRLSFLPRLVAGELAAVAFSEPDAGSDVAAMRTRIHSQDGAVVVDGTKTWITGAAYADLIVVFGQFEDGAAAVVVPTTAPGVLIERVDDPLGCRAAGHATVTLDGVRLPADHLLGGTGHSITMLVTNALAYGRMSVAWGCAGIIRSCLDSVVRHANTRHQFGKPLAHHQLVSRHVAELLVAERIATQACERAGACWDTRSPDMVITTVLAKYVASRKAAEAASIAMQVLASAGAANSHPVARAYRDAKLMEVIEGTNEICQLMLAQHALNRPAAAIGRHM